MSISLGIGLKIGGGGVDWVAYWATHYISVLAVVTTSASEQTVTATIVGTGQDGASFEYSTDYGITWTVAGTSANGIYSATGLISSTRYDWRARLYIGTNYGTYSNIDYAYTSAHTNLIAGWKFDQPEYFSGVMSDYGLATLSYTSSLYYNGVTYITYQGNDDDAYIATYTHATDTWSTPVKVGTNPLANGDGHGAPSLFIDSSGYIHTMFGSHTTDIYYSKSDNPEDISAWTAQAVPANGTYPQFVQFSTGVIYMFYRDNNHVQDWGFRTSADDGASWSAYTKIAGNTAYLTFRKGTGDNIHAVGFGHNQIFLDRFDILYMYFNGTDWLRSDGTTITLPADGATGDILIYDSGADYIPNASFDIDTNNKPIIFFTEGGTAQVADYYHRVLVYNGSAWIKNSVGTKTGNWRNFATAIKYVSSSRIEIITTEDTANIGGNLYLLVSTNGGVTWKNERTLIYGRFLDVAYVQNYNNNAKIVFCEYAATPTTWTRKGYLWGNSGFIKGSLASLGTVCPEMKGLYNGTLVNAPASVTGKFNKGRSFVTGSAQQITIADNDVFSFDVGSPDHALTFSFWVNVPSTNVTAMLLDKFGVGADNEYMAFISTDKIQFNLSNSADAIYAQAPFTTINDWALICCTYDGGGAEAGVKIFINALEAQNVQSHAGTFVGMHNTNELLRIGARNVLASELYLTGSMDEVKIWDKVLSVPEMTALMANIL